MNCQDPEIFPDKFLSFFTEADKQLEKSLNSLIMYFVIKFSSQVSRINQISIIFEI